MIASRILAYGKNYPVEIFGQKVTVDLKNKSGQVIYNASVIDLSSIENKISSIGYSVNDKSANQEAYEKLEICCKKPKEN